MTQTATAVGPWPTDGLEHVPACPVCGSEARARLHAGLRDRLFETPDEWTLWECAACAAGYLDPRPTRDTIARSYERYLTHGAPAKPRVAQGKLANVREAIFNGFLNARYGYQLKPSSRLGGGLVGIAPQRSARVDRLIRHLHLTSAAPRLLDFGCANGEFMLQMRALGWDVRGVDFDPTSVEQARAAGLEADVGSLADLDPDERRYDAITLGHVVEHLHDPQAELERARALLRPGGMVWLATPNIEAIGHQAFGPSWLGLDAPRHLVLFNGDALTGLLYRAGFARVERLRPGPDARSLFKPSLAIDQGLGPLGPDPFEDSPKLSPAWRARAHWAELRSLLNPTNAEELIVAAWAPR